MERMKRWLSMALCVIMVLSNIPTVPVSAQTDVQMPQTETTEVPVAETVAISEARSKAAPV